MIKAGMWHEIKLQSCFLIHLEMFEEKSKDGAPDLVSYWWHQEHLPGERLAPQRSNSSRAWDAGLDYAVKASTSHQPALAGLLMQPLCFWGLRVSELAGESQPKGHETWDMTRVTQNFTAELWVKPGSLGPDWHKVSLECLFTCVPFPSPCLWYLAHATVCVRVLEYATLSYPWHTEGGKTVLLLKFQMNI